MVNGGHAADPVRMIIWKSCHIAGVDIEFLLFVKDWRIAICKGASIAQVSIAFASAIFRASVVKLLYFKVAPST